jgi:phospholipase/carboxylesterase
MSAVTTQSFTHRWLPATQPGLPTLLLLHGTGGNEDDLLGLGEAVLPGAARLSPRGRVLEQGMPRFFRRFAEGVFDLEDLAVRRRELAAWLEAAAETYDFARGNVVALGYSNGANIAAAMLLGGDRLRGAMLLRPMLTHEPTGLPSLRGTSVLAISGGADRITPAPSAARLTALLRQAGAEVRHDVLDGAGHGLLREDVSRAAEWVRQIGAPPAED